MGNHYNKHYTCMNKFHLHENYIINDYYVDSTDKQIKTQQGKAKGNSSDVPELGNGTKSLTSVSTSLILKK
jgi:hypothetical protein